MRRRVDYATLNAHEAEAGLQLTPAPPPKPPSWWKKHEDGLIGTGVVCATLAVIAGIIFGIFALTSEGPFAKPSPPPPPPPKHAYIYRDRSYGFFVVDRGYGYLSHILCHWNEFKVDPMPNGKELVTCIENDGIAGEPFTYNASQEYVE